MSALRALLWDVDGTLAETEGLHLETFNRAFRDFGLDVAWSEDLYRELLQVTGGRERLRHYFARYRPDLVARVDVAALHAHKTRLYGELARNRLQLRPGVVRLLREAKATGLAQAVVTTTSRVNVQTLLRQTLGEEGERLFDVFATGEDVTRKKPAPDLYRVALARLGLAPEACLALEDSPLGVAAARAAGVPVVVVTSPWTRDARFSGALAVFDGFGEPDAPGRRLDGGSPPPGGCLDLASLRALHREAVRDAGRAC